MWRVMALMMRVECNKESDGFGSKSNGNEAGRRLTATRVMATVMATTWVMVTVTVMRLVGDKEGKGEGGKGNGDGDEGGGRRRGNGDGGAGDGDNGGG